MAAFDLIEGVPVLPIATITKILSGQPLSFGDYAHLLLSQADPNAHSMVMALPDPDGTRVPVFIFGRQNLKTLDVGMFHGVTEPHVVLANAAGDRFMYSRYVAGAWRTATNAAVQWAFDCSTFFNSTAVLGPNIDLQLGFGQGNLRVNTAGDDDLRLGLAGTNLFLIGPDGQRATSYGQGPQPHPTIMGTSATAYGTATDEWWSQHHNGTDAIKAAGKGGHRYVFNETGGGSICIKSVDAVISGASGGSETLSGLLPAKKRILDVLTYIQADLGTSNGLTSIQVGDGSDPDRWGEQSTLTAGATTDSDDYTADPEQWQSAAGDVVITAVGGTGFDGSGDIHVTVIYKESGALTS